MKVKKLMGIAVIGVVLLISFGLIIKLYDTSLKINTLSNLENTLRATHNALKFWVNGNVKNISRITKVDDINNDLFIDWIVINKDFSLINSKDSNSIKYIEPLERYQKQLGYSLLSQNIRFIPPVLINEKPFILFITPFMDNDFFLVLVKDYGNGFSDISKIGISRSSVESYFINGKGKFLSTGRFYSQLRNLGLVSGTESSVLSFEVKDPGGNLLNGYKPKIPRRKMKFTKMAQSIIEKEDGYSSKAYNDYRGVPVYGHWLWDEELQIGIAVEIDAEEALESLENIILYIVIIFILIFIISALIDYIIKKSLFKKAELNKRIEEAQEIAQLGHWDWDLRTGLVNLSKISMEVLGFEKHTIPFQKFFRQISVKDRKRIRTIIETAIHNKKRFNFICEIINGDNEKYIDIKGTIEAFEREILKFKGTILDVTKLEKNQRELTTYKNYLEELVQERSLELSRTKEEVLHEKQISDKIIDSMPTLFFLIDSKGVVLRHNKNFSDFIGYSGEGLTKTIDELLGIDFQSMKNNVIDLGYYQLEIEVKTVWKVSVPFLFTITSLKIKEDILFIGTGTDLSDIRAAMNEIKKLSLVVEQSPASIVITDKNGDIEYTNPAFTTITGYDAYEVAGENPRILKSGLMDEVFYKNLWKTISSGNTWHGELINKNKLGELYWESAFISPIFNENKEIESYLSIKENITDRKKLEEELIVAKEKAESNANAKSMFLANMSHEIRTPMNSIIGFIELTLDSGTIGHDASQYLDTALESARTLLRIINDILDISKLEAKKFKIINKTINLHNELRKTIRLLSQQAKDKGIQLELVLPDFIPEYIISDSIRLHQILVNLMGNAIKFTHKGFVKLVMDTHKEGYLLFCIEDSGIGMTKEQVENIFDAFSQADISTAKRYEGTGLGTTISKELVTLLGGEVWIESSFGKGTKFYFTIPKVVSNKANEEDESDIVNENKDKRYYNILLAEDIYVNSTLVKVRMSKAGHKLTIVDNGIDAVEAAEKGDYNAILMDVHMPYMDGLEATKEIKNLENCRNTPIIALTASVMEDELKRCKEAGMVDIVSKPVKFERLFGVLDKYCQEGSLTPYIELPENTSKENFESSEFIDFEVALDIWKDKSVYFDALNTFVNKYSNSGEELNSLILNKNYDDAFKLAHTLKGVTGNLYIYKVYEIISKISDSLKAGDYSSVEDEILRYENELSNVLNYLNNRTGMNEVEKKSVEELISTINIVLVMAKRGTIDSRVEEILPLISVDAKDKLEEAMESNNMKQFIETLEAILTKNQN